MGERRRSLFLVVVWVVAIGVGLAVAALTRIGPVLVAFDNAHGVHAGDVFAVLLSAAVAADVTRRVRR